MHEVPWLSLTALTAAIMAIGLGIAALVLALDDDPVGPTFNFGNGAAGESGRVRPALPGLEDFFERFGDALPGALIPEAAETRPFLGVTAEAGADGVTITAVSAGSGADEAGVQADDLIAAVNGGAVSTVDELRDAIAPHESGDAITLTVQRGNDTLELEVTLGETAVPTRTFPVPVQPRRTPEIPTSPSA